MELSWTITEQTMVILKKEQEKTGNSISKIVDEVLDAFLVKMEKKGMPTLIRGMSLWRQFETLTILLGQPIPLVLHQAVMEHFGQLTTASDPEH